jgi:GT2 family glycosyltransferase/glycosyltransferase involved in cell wall biosynthesis
MTAAPVTVLIPVYAGLDDLVRCLDSVVRHAPSCTTPFELLIIEDASPEPAVRAYVEEFATRPAPVPVTVLHNEHNLGFVGTVNRGLRRIGGDVVLLNNDAAVTTGWLDRLAAVAALPDVATVTPLTSEGSICTLPRSIVEEFDLAGSAPRIDECAAFVAQHSVRLLPEVITGVGFCMWVTKEALDRCGELDEDAFGRGYGEEVDFCMRATRAGMRHLVDDSTFVYHRGGGSFGDEQRERLAAASRTIDDRYPFFRPANTAERRRDPLQVSFAALELELHPRDTTRPHVLQIVHSPPTANGGTEKFLRALMEALRDEFDFSVMYPVTSGFGVHTYWQVGDRLVELEFLLPGAPRQVTAVHDELAAEAVELAKAMFDFDAVHVHNLIGHSLSPLGALADFDGPVVCQVHDLFLACPNFSLLYEKRESCGIPDDRSYCERCLADIAVVPMPGSPMISNLSLEYLDRHRAEVSGSLDAVDVWLFPTQSAADYLLRAYDVDPARMRVIEHGAVMRLARPRRTPDPAHVYDEPLRVAFVGLGWSKKGLDAVNALADHFAGSTIEIHQFGELREPVSPVVHAHGPYDNEFLPEFLHLAGIHVVLLPGAYAETFGFVMTEALVGGIPVIGAHYGALGERIRATGAGWTIDPMDHAAIATLVERLDRARSEVFRASRQAASVPLVMVGETAHEYAALYRAETLREKETSATGN